MRPKSTLKQFDAYVEGDGDLRRDIFAEPPASQQLIFQLFANLDHIHYGFFLFFSGIPSTTLWDMFLSQLSAVASGSARNRNFCEDYDSLTQVKERTSPYGGVRDKILNLVGASHALWWEMSDPNYESKPNAYGIWKALIEINPSRMVWEWWFESRCREAVDLWERHKNHLTEPGVVAKFEEWAEESLGLLRPRTHWYSVVMMFIDTFKRATAIKHRIALPYLRIVYTIAKSIAAYNQPNQFFDTFNIACAGLMRSIAKYAPSMSMAFSNFADREIRYEVYYQLSNYNLVTLPHKTWQKHREFEFLRKEFFEIHKREASLDELAEAYDLDRKEVYDIYQQVAIQNPCSLDQKVFSDEKSSHPVTLKDRIEDHQYVEAQKSHEDQEILFLSLLRMSQRDRKIFIAINNLCDLVQDLAPDKHDLDRFFLFKEQSVSEKKTNRKNTLNLPEVLLPDRFTY